VIQYYSARQLVSRSIFLSVDLPLIRESGEVALTPQFDLRGILSLMDSANTDPELAHWLRWASESGSAPRFVRTVAEAALMACSPDYVLLRPVLLELKRQHPEPEPGQAALDDPGLRDWLRWASQGGSVPSFVGRVVKAAICACESDYALLRPVLVELKRRYPEGSTRRKFQIMRF